MSRPQVEPFFLSRDKHSLFCLLFSPPAGRPIVGAVLHVPAFAEEMNKSRRAVANAARAMAERGRQVLLLDLHGTGDSSDDFGDATWPGWLDDVCAAVAWLRERSGASPALWGLRSGCLLINDLLDRVDCPNLLYWQPALSGDAMLMQFLRLRAMAGAVGGTDGPKETTRTLLGSLEGGTALEIAGYMLSPLLALPYKEARLGGPRYAGRRVTWLEMGLAAPPELTPASAQRIERIRADGARVTATAVAGHPFWMTQEIDEGAAFVSATAALMAEAP